MGFILVKNVNYLLRNLALIGLNCDAGTSARVNLSLSFIRVSVGLNKTALGKNKSNCTVEQDS